MKSNAEGHVSITVHLTRRCIHHGTILLMKSIADPHPILFTVSRSNNKKKIAHSVVLNRNDCRGSQRLRKTNDSVTPAFVHSWATSERYEILLIVDSPNYCRMDVVGLISGGKDSCYNMMCAVEAGNRVVALANLHPGDRGELDSYMYQSVGSEGIEVKCFWLPSFDSVESCSFR